jgi:hypothetical protein
MTALGAAMMMAAARSGVADDLLPEMMEIADFVGAGRPEAELYKSLAAFYLQLAGENKKAASDIITRLNE